MSYMDRDNILDEGIFDKLSKKIKKLMVKGMTKLDPESRKLRKDALKHAKAANDILDDLLKRNNIKY